MGKLVNLAGKTFGRLTVISKSYSIKRGPRSTVVFWQCRCSCGAEAHVRGDKLKSGNTRSCGCYHLEKLKKDHFKHGDSMGAKEYRTWALMLARCKPCRRNSDNKNYYERGIRVCERWRISYQNFLSDVGRSPGPNYSIDRIDNDGNYEPGNVRWATREQQMRNRRVTRLWIYKNESKTLREWSDALSLSLGKIRTRLYRYGWSVERAFETP